MNYNFNHINGFKPLNNGMGIQSFGPTPFGGDFHDNFRVNTAGQISNGHTTARIQNGQNIHMGW